jgi:hypothetical protein
VNIVSGVRQQNPVGAAGSRWEDKSAVISGEVVVMGQQQLQPGHARSRRNWLIASIVVVLIAAAGACHSKATGGELELTAAADPGPNAFMPAAASPPPTNTQPPPTLQPQGDGNTVETAPLPGDREGLYGGTLNNAEVDRDKIADFLSANPQQATSFTESFNSDTSFSWSGGNHLAVADVPRYLRELTPAVLRLDTRITDHGFDGTHLTARQSVFQAGNAVLVDAHGVPRVRGLSGNPLTAPIPLKGEPRLLGTPWPGYHPGGLARVEATSTAIGNFVLVDVVTGQPFNRAAGTTGTNDTPHAQAVAPPGPSSAMTTTTAQKPELDIDGTYLFHNVIPGGCDRDIPDYTMNVTHQGNTLKLGPYQTGTLNGDGSFATHYGYVDMRGVFATEGGRTVIRDGTADQVGCHTTFVATKQ